MARRTKHKDETCYAYMLEMKELGKRGKLADYVAIQYIIDGIIDHEANKTLLYGASSYSELKEKFKLYETYKDNIRKSYTEEPRRTRFETQARHASNMSGGERQYSTKLCYNCGEINHLSSACPKQGRKCFNCNNFGHISMECPEKKTSPLRPSQDITKLDPSKPDRARASTSGIVRNTSAPFGSGKQAFYNTTTTHSDGGATSNDVESNQLYDGVFFVSNDVNHATNNAIREFGIAARDPSTVIGSSGKMASDLSTGSARGSALRQTTQTSRCTK